MSTLRWTPAHDPHAVRGVALAIHGLNYDPTRMQPAVDCLTANRYDCLTLSLHGHGENYLRFPGVDADAARLCSFARVTFRLWREEAEAAYRLARLHADARRLPLLLTGYSLGGLMVCALVASGTDVQADGLLLFAPALAVSPNDLFFRLAERLPRGVLPSVAPREVRANRGTPGAAYAALYAGISSLNDGALPRLNAPALVFMDPRDEVVSYQGVRAIADQMSNWSVYEVEKSDGTNGRMYHHLLLGETAVGEDAWRGMAERMTAYLGAVQRSSA